jgi:hypothetical protein
MNLGSLRQYEKAPRVLKKDTVRVELPIDTTLSFSNVLTNYIQLILFSTPSANLSQLVQNPYVFALLYS